MKVQSAILALKKLVQCSFLDRLPNSASQYEIDRHSNLGNRLQFTIKFFTEER
jgi:hypothetical protein